MLLLVLQWYLLWANALILKTVNCGFSQLLEGEESAVGMAGAAGRPRVPLGFPRKLRGSGRGLLPCTAPQWQWLTKTWACVTRLPRERDNWSNCFGKFSSWYSACKAACHRANRAMWAVASFSGNQKCLFSMGSAYSCKRFGSGFWGFFDDFFFLFHLTGRNAFFPKPVFAPLRLVADPAAADLVLSLHLNKHSCPDWQKPCLWFPRYLHRQGC